MVDMIPAKLRVDPGDYEENGILFCGKCRTPKQTVVELSDGHGGTVHRTMPVLCQCAKAADDAARQAEETEKFLHELQKRREGISDSAYLRYDFAQDDRKNAKLSAVCRKYVDQWDEMRRDNMGILFYGSFGTGKSFYACAIANELARRKVPTVATNFPRLLNLLQSSRDRQAILDNLQTFALLVIDDLGVERDSTYAAEQVYNVIDARSRSGLPLIVTTNLTMNELEHPESMQHARIYDRVLEQCPIKLKMTGDSRRAGIASARAEKARQLLLD